MLYGIGCDILAGLFHLNEDQKNQDVSIKIHEIGSALGFTVLFFCLLLLSTAAFNADYFVWGTASILSFAAVLTFFLFFAMGKKRNFPEQFCNTEVYSNV